MTQTVLSIRPSAHLLYCRQGLYEAGKETGRKACSAALLRLLRGFFLSCLVLVFGLSAFSAGTQRVADPCARSVALLRDALQQGKTFFIKVHAAEALLMHGQSNEIGPLFQQLRQQASANEIGALRVLARLNRDRAAAYKDYTGQLRAHMHDTASLTRLAALESLGKLGCSATDALVRRYADTGTGAFKAMARWVLSNKGTPAGEDSLSGLLLSPKLDDYRYAAYALRFKAQVRAQTVERLVQCLAALKADDRARVYVASCLFIHARGAARLQAKRVLLAYAGGNTGQRYETAEALGTAGTAADLPLLQRLQADSETDVQVAAANAVLKILRCRGSSK